MEIEGWRGASGTCYAYTVVEIGQQPNTAYGNYIFAKVNPAGGWDAVFIGHGELSQRTDLGSHSQADFIRGKGATHVHIRVNPSLPERMIERMDILEVHPEAYQPPGSFGARRAEQRAARSGETRSEPAFA